MNCEYDILAALDAFIRKYYKNLLVRGLLLAIAILVTLFLAMLLLEHFGWLPQLARGLLFWGGMAAAVVVLAILVVRPLFKMQGLGNRLSHQDAAKIIGRHFPEVSDKLLNLLQLLKDGSRNAADEALLLAAVKQKTDLLKPVPFLNAIDIWKNRRYLKYAIPPLVIIAVVLMVSPQVLTAPGKRIVHYRTTYERPAPFRFSILNDHLEAQSGEDFELIVGIVDAEALPEEVFVVADGLRGRMRKTAADRFCFMFKQVRRPLQFSLEGGGVRSVPYNLEVRPSPAVVSFRMLLSCPAYTGRQDEIIVDLGDAIVPEGTKVRWLFQLQDADSLHFSTGQGSGSNIVSADNGGKVEMALRVMQTTSYAFSVSNAYRHSDTLAYTLSAIPDAAPMIAVEEVIDSTHPDRHLFKGRIKDDYGFSKLVFMHSTSNPTLPVRDEPRMAEIALGEGASQEFFFSFNIAELSLAPGDRLSYFFEVSDNDAVHGPKTTRSTLFEMNVPTSDCLDSLLQQNSGEIRQSAESQIDGLRQLQEEINNLIRRLVDKKDLSWQDKKDLEQLAEKQRQIRQQMQQMRQQIQENNRLEHKYREQNEQLMEKQRELDRLFNEVMDDKMKATLTEMDRLMKELDKKQVQQQLDKLKLDNADLEKQLERNIELMKRLEIEKKVDQTIQNLDKLSTEQREVSRETEQSIPDNFDSLKEKQQELNTRFQQLKSDIDQIQNDYKNLDPSTDFKMPDELIHSVEHYQQGAQRELNEGKNKNASERQKQAADAMDQLSSALTEAQAEAEEQEMAEDSEQIRQLLKNLVNLSFRQEELIDDVNATYIQDPRYHTIISRQRQLKDDFRSVEDSLHSLSKRQIQVASVIGNAISEVNSSVGRTLSDLLGMNEGFYGSYKNTQVARPMQYSMTALNNLALVLAESLDTMQNQMRQNSQRRNKGQRKMSGKSMQQCSSPGPKPSPKSMQQLQQELNKQMEALKKQLEQNGKQKDGRHKIGQGQSMSEAFARMAAQQELIRQMMHDYGQQLKEQSPGNAKLAKEIDQIMRQMEQTEADLVNRTITRQTLQRQHQILTRLLQHEKAELQQEKEERRESKEATGLYGTPNPDELEKQFNQKQSSQDHLRTVPPALTPYYRTKVNDYFYR